MKRTLAALLCLCAASPLAHAAPTDSLNEKLTNWIADLSPVQIASDVTARVDMAAHRGLDAAGALKADALELLSAYEAPDLSGWREQMHVSVSRANLVVHEDNLPVSAHLDRMVGAERDCRLGDGRMDEAASCGVDDLYPRKAAEGVFRVAGAVSLGGGAVYDEYGVQGYGAVSWRPSEAIAFSLRSSPDRYTSVRAAFRF